VNAAADDPNLERAILRKVRRTLARMEALTRVNPNFLAEMLAKESPHYMKRLLLMSLHLELTAGRMNQIAPARKCAACGFPLGFAVDEEGLGLERIPRADAHYCSPRCRQKAHRKRRRVAAGTAPATTKPSRRNGSSSADDNISVTQERGAP